MTRHTGEVERGWGSETIFATNDLYCGKLLNFNKGAKFSMHMHKNKDETWYVLSGKFVVKTIDTENADVHEQKLKVGDVVRQRVGQPHQIEALTDGTIFEVSTQHFDEDSYRVWKGDSQ